MKVNIACGQRKLFGFINVDADPWVQPDVVAAPMDLPFDRGSVGEIHAARVLEHLADPVAALRYWRGLLEPGGLLWIAVVDARAVCPAYVGTQAPALQTGLLAADESRPDHCFTPYFLTLCLQNAGFREIRRVITSPHLRVDGVALLTYRAVQLHPVQRLVRRLRRSHRAQPFAWGDHSVRL